MAHVAGDGNGTHIVGTESDDIIVGHRKAELIEGLGGNDYINGGLGADTITGGDGNDILDGYVGVDQLTGGAGNDTFEFSVWSDSRDIDGERDTITDFSASDDFIDLHDIAGYGIPLTMANVVVETVAAGSYIVHVTPNEDDGSGFWNLGVVVLGDAPVEANFIF